MTKDEVHERFLKIVARAKKKRDNDWEVEAEQAERSRPTLVDGRRMPCRNSDDVTDRSRRKGGLERPQGRWHE